MWAYTDFSDKRWSFTKKYLVLRNDPANIEPQKTGLFNPHTIGAYLNNGVLFVKRSDAPGKPEDYPDFGCSFETFTNNEFLEMETLGALMNLGSGKSATHIENWSLHKDVHVNSITDGDLDRLFASLE
jgi:hypothetical protein